VNDHQPLPTTGGPPAPPRRTTRRDDVIREAALLFDARGYHAASMEDIAEAVGIRKPTLYHYFSSKDEILFWIHEEFVELLIGRHEQRLATGLDPEALLLGIMSDILGLMETHRGHVRVFFEHHRELPADQHTAIARKRDRYQQMASDVIRQGVEQGRFRPDLDVGLATLAMFGTCNWAYQWYASTGELTSEEIAGVFWRQLLDGIAAPAAGARR
jgi:AcrR family transcriptional regulator